MDPEFTMPIFTPGVNALPAIRDLKARVTAMLKQFDEQHNARRAAAKGLKVHFASAAELEKALGTPAESTKKAYQRRAKGLLQAADLLDCDVWDAAEGLSNSRASWVAASAALKFVLPLLVREAKNRLDILERTAAHKRPTDFASQVRDALHEMCRYANMLVAAPEKSPDCYPQKPDRTRGASKKYSLKGLPTDWDMEIYRSLTDSKRGSKTSLSVEDAALLWLVQCVTGCRSQELTLGVSVKVKADGSALIARVEGAKRGLNAGQKHRAIEVIAGAGAERALADWLGPGTYRVVRLEDRHLEAYRKRVSRRGGKLTPDRPAKRRPSAYTARNAFKAKLDAAGVSKVDKAKAMGHRTTKSSRYYGGSATGSGTVKPLRIAATSSVKERAPYRSSKIPSVVVEDLRFASSGNTPRKNKV